MITPKKIEANDKLKSIVVDSIIETRTIDYTGDGRMDYVCSSICNSIQTDHWITADYVKIKEQNYSDAYYRFWFLQLDNDNELETFSAWGYPEGIDYYFTDINYNTKKETILLYFNPVILDSTNSKIAFWGYAWDIIDIFSRNDKILCSINHKIEQNGAEITIPDWQIILPIVFFKGKSTQPDVEVEPFFDVQYMTIKELMNKVMQ